MTFAKSVHLAGPFLAVIMAAAVIFPAAGRFG